MTAAILCVLLAAAAPAGGEKPPAAPETHLVLKRTVREFGPKPAENPHTPSIE